MFTLFFVWLAGGFAALGALNGATKVEDVYVESEVKITKFVQSWYAFGEFIGIMIAEIGKNKEKEE